jgi:hypothetical protein
MAVALAREHGVHRTARTLGLKYESLQKHLATTTGGGDLGPGGLSRIGLKPATHDRVKTSQ